ncbi:hypothetical protein C6P40_003605 [Pichia californica]|uniref:Uncharacterized protein n=1 Tax=Pichia californica TaxID=460514 RepID=A0A9P7BHM1_9ASCO|nr:hypothetical protein C6P42_003373 [[Candida] californica]KAG0690214.1 hypothetical protein C6P40_003605 [[Candida] californica]
MNSGSKIRSPKGIQLDDSIPTNTLTNDNTSSISSYFNSFKSYSPLSSSTSSENLDSLQTLNNNNNTNCISFISLNSFRKFMLILRKFVKYIGPGLMVSVAYMDPGNFSSSIASAQFQYKLLFSLVVSNIMAGFLQVLASKLGICTGQDLASNCRRHLPPKLNYLIYLFAEISVIATDVAEIIGTAIAFNIIFNIPLIIGVLLSILDMLFVVMAYRPDGPMILLRIFEGFVSLLVFGTVICFAIELAKVSPTTNWKDVGLGFLPSKIIFTDIKGLYLSAALLGSNLMPHSLYLGSGVVQARMKAFDIKMGHYVPPSKLRSRGIFTLGSRTNADDEIDEDQRERETYKPSIDAIDETMSYTVAELVVSLIIVALFVNAAILIVAGSALSTPTDDDGDGALETADLFTLHHLLTSHLSKAAGSVFAFALLCSGLCGGTVVTIAGQMIMEGHAHVSIPPGIKRIITRGIALIPCILVVLTGGREGLSSVLNASQVVLSFVLPFICAPLIYFTSSRDIMKVEIYENSSDPNYIELDDISDSKFSSNKSNNNSPYTEEMEVGSVESHLDDDEVQHNQQQQQQQHQQQNNLRSNKTLVSYKNMSNGKITTIAAIIIWALITFLNFWLLISMALGKDVPV